MKNITLNELLDVLQQSCYVEIYIDDDYFVAGGVKSLRCLLNEPALDKKIFEMEIHTSADLVIHCGD